VADSSSVLVISMTATFTGILSTPSLIQKFRLYDFQTLVTCESRIAVGLEDLAIPTAYRCLCPRKTTSTAFIDRRV
jgi:hypothetical protein